MWEDTAEVVDNSLFIVADRADATLGAMLRLMGDIFYTRQYVRDGRVMSQ